MQHERQRLQNRESFQSQEPMRRDVQRVIHVQMQFDDGSKQCQE